MNNRLASFASILYCALLIWYSYLEMTALETATLASSSLAFTKVSVIILSLLFIFKSGFKRKTSFCDYWYAWIIWLIFELIVYLLRGGKGFGFLHNFFAPFCFLLVFSLSKLYDGTERYLRWGFIILYLFTGGYALYLSFTYNVTTIEAGRFVSNLVFWPLCPFVFITLVRRPIIKYILFIPMVLLTLFLAKRSAIIILLWEIIVFSIAQVKNVNRGRGRLTLLLYIVVAILALGFITTRFSQYADRSFARFDTMQNDRGSGRIQVYDAALNNISGFTLFELIAGRGFGSITEIGNTNAHNDAIQLFYEYGLVGLIFYLVLFVILLKRLKTVKKLAEEYYVGYVFCIITIFVLGMLSNLIPFNSYFAFLCSYLAMAEAAIYKRTRTKSITSKVYY